MRYDFVNEHFVHHVFLLQRVFRFEIKFMHDFSDHQIFENEHVKETHDYLMVVYEPGSILIL
jgi:hypothetical protein